MCVACESREIERTDPFRIEMPGTQNGARTLAVLLVGRRRRGGLKMEARRPRQHIMGLCPFRVNDKRVLVRLSLGRFGTNGRVRLTSLLSMIGGGAARKRGQSAARKVIHRKDVHSTLF